LQPFMSGTAGALAGNARVPGDKSISHRALMVGALAVGESEIHGLLEGEDVLRSAAAMRALGAEAWRDDKGVWRVIGRGVGGLIEPADVLDLGNAGTGARLLMGVVATHRLTAFFTGDASLRRRPMARVVTPLSEMGAVFTAREGYRLPLAVQGTGDPLPIRYRLPVPSAQVKSAILLAGLNAPGETTVIEPEPTRDHTELMLRHFGAEVRVAAEPEGRVVTLVGEPELTGRRIEVPADPSSAAFPMVAALIAPGSDVILTGVMTNPLRTGLIATLREMGADIEALETRTDAGEAMADLRIRAGALRGVEVPALRAPAMIDEYPVLAVAAACAQGTTVMRGLKELRVKESDRLAATADMLRANGVEVEIVGDDLIVHGKGQGDGVPGGGVVATHMDHRIAMSALVMGVASARPVTVDDAAFIATSFPGFADLMRGLGADFVG